MKTILTNLRMLALLMVFTMAAKVGFSQGTCPSGAPSFNVWIANDTNTAPNTFQFDIWMQSTSGSPINLRTSQFGIYLNPAFTGAGTLTMSYLYNIHSTPGNKTYDPTWKLLRTSVNIGVSCAFPTIINTTPTLLMTIQVVSTQPYNCAPKNLSFNFTIGGGKWPTAFTWWTGTCLSETFTGCGTYSVIAPEAANIVGLGSSYNDTDPVVALTGTPAGGTFTVDGLPAASFDPQTVGVGPHTVIYALAPDGMGCVRADTQIVTVSGVIVCNITNQIQATAIACAGGPSDITIDLTGATPPVSYSLNGGPTVSGGVSMTFPGAAGSYTVDYTDANGCTGSASITITEPPQLVASCSSTDATCNGSSDGSTTVTASGGTGPYTGTGTTTGLVAGTYTYTVTDNNGCTASCTATVNEPAALVATCSATDVSCNGGNNGSTTVTASGGTAPYTGTGTTTGLVAGTYTYTVTDNNGCTASCTATVNEPAVLVASCSGTDVSCNGGSDGTATVTASGGTAPYTGTGTTNGLVAGTYTYTVTDNNGCTASCSVTINEPSALSASCSVINDVSCNGGTNGAADVQASGGTPPYTGTGPQTGLAAGTYSFTVTDSKGCTSNCSVTITEPTLLVASCSSTDATCNGSSDGSTTVTASGGTGPYTGTGTTTGLVAGTYTYTVTDNNGCTASCTATVNEPALLVASCSATDVSCNGGNNGTTTVTASGGTAPYTGTGTTTGLVAGTYTYTVTDNNGCTATCTATVNEPALLVASCSGTDVSCNGGSDGTATVTASGGTAPYTGTGTTNGLVAGTYTYTVTDNNGCTASCSVTINEPSALSASCSVINDVSCNGGTNGSADVQASGGTPPYSGTGAQTGLAAGSYTFTVTDSKGCTSTCSVTINEPAALSATATATDASCQSCTDGSVSLGAVSGGTPPYIITPASPMTGLAPGNYCFTITDNNGCSITACATVGAPGCALVANCSGTDVTCNGGSDGSASVSVTGAIGSLDYLWSNGGTGASATGLAAGTYSVTVTDLTSGCTANCSVTINEPAALVASCSGTDVSCNGGLDGSATVSASGGTAPYSGTGTFSGLAAGTYTYSVTDNNGCTASCTVTINEPAALVASCSGTDISCNGANDGTATVTASGGTAPYTGTGTTTGLAAGTYTYTVTDNNGCTASCSVTINEPSVLTISAVPGGTIQCFGGTVAVTVTGSGGTPPYTGEGTFNQGGGSDVYTVTDAHGCTASTLVTLTEPTKVEGIATAVDATCGQNDGSVSVTASGGAGNYTYLWSPGGGTTSTVTGLGAGTYTVTITDANGCTGTASATVGGVGGGPGAAGPISGSPGVCRGQNGVVYSIAPVPFATSYIWTLPSGATGTSTTESITVDFDLTYSGGFICVTPQNSCGQGTMSCINVLALTVRPLQPGPVSGPQIICGGSSGTVATYSIAPVINATSYNWVVTGAGVSIASGQGTTTVDVNIPAGFGQGSISVAASNCVGNSQTSGMTLTGVPIHSSALFGPGTVCANTLGVNYFISNVNGTTGYTWTTTGDMTVVTSSGPSCVVDFGPAFNGGTLSVTTFSVCGSFTRTYTIKATPNQPGGITGPFTSVCSATGVTYSIAPVAGATSYIWTLPAGVTPSTPLNGTSITVDFAPGFSSGTICVAAINGCGTGTARCGLIKAVPGAGGAITGPASVCKSQTGVGYSIAPITGASSYIWSVTGGASIAPGGTSATVNFNSALSSVAVIKVNGVNSCGYGSPGQKVVSVNLGCRTTDDELSSAPVLSAYPNPTHGILTVNFTASSTARYVVKVTDLLGNVVVSDVMNAVEGLNMTDLNLGKVAKGMYLLSLETDGADAQTMRIVVE